MNKEPIALYVFRYIVWGGMLAFMVMLYWSSDLLEQEFRATKVALQHLEDDLGGLRSDLAAITATLASSPSVTSHPDSATSIRPHIDPKYDNLLTQDPFYTTVLPQQLLPKGFVPWGVFQDDTLGKPEDLHPFSLWGTVRSFQQLCIAQLSKSHFGKYENFAPSLAIKVEMRPSKVPEVPEFWIHLRDDVYWQPLKPEYFPSGMDIAPHFLQKHKVTAHDFKFWFDAARNPYVGLKGASAVAQQMQDLSELEIIDDYTFVLRWKAQEVLIDGKKQMKILYRAKLLSLSLEPLPCFLYQYFADGSKIVEDDHDSETYKTNSVWAQNFTEHWAKNIIASCGAYIFGGMTDEALSFKRNPYFYDKLEALVAERRYTIRESIEAFWQDFQTGQIPCYIIRPEKLLEWEAFSKSPNYLAQVKQGNAIKQIDYPQSLFSYVGWNETTPYFQSQKVRMAMALAIDRKRIIEQNLNGMAEEITSSLMLHTDAYDTSVIPLPYNPREARRLLQAEGWYDSTGDGVIDKEINGRRVPFRFTLTYYVKSPTGKAISEYIAVALKEVGIDCQLNGVDITDLSQAMDDKSFDALLGAWSYDSPPQDLRQLWHSSGAKEKGSSNFIGFANRDIDDIIDALDYEYDPAERLKLYHRFHHIIYEEQPYLFLFVPKARFLYRENVEDVFIPADRQDLAPGAVVSEPIPSIFYLRRPAPQ